MPKSPSSDASEVGFYVYGVVPARADLPQGLRGLDDAPVQFVQYNRIAAAVGRITLDRPPGRRADLMAHSHVVDALARATTVVPVQFGSVVADRTDVVDDLLEPQGDRFARLLDVLEGRSQFIVRATYLEEQVLAEVVKGDPEIADLHRRTRDIPPGTPHPDLIRLGERVAGTMDDKRRTDAELVLGPLKPHVIDMVERPGGGVDHLLDVAVLVEGKTTQQFEDTLEVLAEAVHERIRISLTGPLAPYDFVEGEQWD